LPCLHARKQRIFARGQIQQIKVVVSAVAQTLQQRQLSIFEMPSILPRPGLRLTSLMSPEATSMTKTIARSRVETAGIDGDLLSVVGPGIESIVVFAAIG